MTSSGSNVLNRSRRLGRQVIKAAVHSLKGGDPLVAPGLGAQNALLGGGRYDGLVAELGGPPIPGFGFALGMERLVLLLPADRVQPATVDAILVGLGEAGWDASIGLARRLRSRGLRVAMALSERPLGAQMKHAERLQARFAVFVGGEELARGVYGLKDLPSRVQVSVDEEAIVHHVSGGGGRHGR